MTMAEKEFCVIHSTKFRNLLQLIMFKQVFNDPAPGFMPMLNTKPTILPGCPIDLSSHQKGDLI